MFSSAQANHQKLRYRETTAVSRALQEWYDIIFLEN